MDNFVRILSSFKYREFSLCMVFRSYQMPQIYWNRFLEWLKQFFGWFNIFAKTFLVTIESSLSPLRGHSMPIFVLASFKEMTRKQHKTAKTFGKLHTYFVLFYFRAFIYPKQIFDRAQFDSWVKCTFANDFLSHTKISLFTQIKALRNRMWFWRP